MNKIKAQVETLLTKKYQRWLDRDLSDIGATNICTLCSEPAISVGDGLCRGHFTEALHAAIMDGNAVLGQELIEKLKKKLMDI